MPMLGDSERAVPSRNNATSHKTGVPMTDVVAVLPRPDIDERQRADVPDEWGHQSFPASDPPQNW
ncbi:hypothetical protein [Actinophytocola sp. NPDC049390]|uniref:hypothetical protein n=1 Tax=Actinophytocola sp. NPDC049390 TaxID=3363894 RepID=UPI0037A56207